MPRSGEEARRRLQQAALELYGERGYDQVTTAEIAARAGVTERTYFRHYPDKREVLFWGEADLLTGLSKAIADAPGGLEPLEILERASGSMVGLLAANRPYAEPARKIIASTPALRERSLAKTATVMDAVAAALRERGVPGRMATVAAQAGYMAFSNAVGAWGEDPGKPLETHIREAFDDLRALTRG